MRPDCKIQDKIKNKDIYMEQRAEAYVIKCTIVLPL